MGAIMELGGDKPNRFRSKVRSSEASVTILKGSPVYYTMAGGTGDGIDVVSAEALPAASQTFFAGIALQDIPPGKYREILCHGVCEFTRVYLVSRSASSATWPTAPALTKGDYLVVMTAAGQQGFNTGGAAASGVYQKFNVANSLAAGTGAASSVGGTALSSFGSVKVFVRGL